MSPVVTLPTIVTRTDVEDAVIATLKPRLEYYLPQMEYQIPRAWVRKTEFEKWPENQTPTIVVVCPGMADKPRRAGDGTYIAYWAVGVAVLVYARDEEQSRKVAGDFAGLIRAILLQESGLHGFSHGITWLDETYEQLPTTSNRSLGTAELVFAIEVADVVKARELPYMPEGPLPTPTDVDIETTDVEVEEVTP